MTVPGVGPGVALTFRTTVDVPARFRNSRAVGVVLGLTPCKHQSGERDRTGAISKCGDDMMRVVLYEAAQILLVRTVRPTQRLFRLVLEPPSWKGPGAESKEKHEPASDIDTGVVDSPKALDPNRPIREADIFT